MWKGAKPGTQRKGGLRKNDEQGKGTEQQGIKSTSHGKVSKRPRNKGDTKLRRESHQKEKN